MNQRKAYVGIAVAAVLVVLAGGLLGSLLRSGSLSTSSGSESDWAYYIDLDSMIRDSDQIVVARLVDETPERVEIPSLVTEHPGVFRQDIIRSYEIVETLRGEPGSGEVIRVWNTPSVFWPATGNTPARTDEWGDVTLERGQTYLLFLFLADREGEAIWGHIGTPSIAHVSGEELRFLAPQRYFDKLAQRGIAPALADSAAPFDVTLSELRSVVASGR